jgi:hypothetical protein
MHILKMFIAVVVMALFASAAYSQITIASSASIKGTVALQGTAGGTIPSEIQMSATIHPTAGGATTTVFVASDGQYHIASVPAGDYVLRIDAPGFLSAEAPTVTVVNAEYLMPPVQLRGGLANTDVIVDIQDLSAIAAWFGNTLTGRIDSSGRYVDINADGVVSIRDISVAASNFGATSPDFWSESAQISTTPNLKVAFIGDQGINDDAEAVLNLIISEGADLVLHQGDLWYDPETDPQMVIDWEAQLDSTLGPDFPYFVSAGNHDVISLGVWSQYQSLLQARIDRIPEVVCQSVDEGVGVKSACVYEGLFFLLLGPGTLGSGFDAYIDSNLTQSDSIWRICSWHYNMTKMQIGGKLDVAGWGPYRECREGGAIIATGHQHSYERTKTLSNLEFQEKDSDWPDPQVLRVGGGSTFVFVSGLGGRGPSHQLRCLPTTPPYGCEGVWAMIYSIEQGSTPGALFIEFNVDGDPNKGIGYFKNIDQEIIDSFTVYAEMTP